MGRDIEGVGPAFSERLWAAGVKTHVQLLRRGATRAGRATLAEATGIDGRTILDWVSRADLMRVKGIGSEFADLLEAAGVGSTSELSRRDAKKLAATIEEVVTTRPGLVRRAPSTRVVARWIEESKRLPRIVEP